MLKKWSCTKVKSTVKSSPPRTFEGWNSASANMVFVVCTLHCTIAVLHVPWTKTTVVFYSFMCLTTFTTFFREFLGQAWMKKNKEEKAPNICLMTERFNDVSYVSHY